MSAHFRPAWYKALERTTLFLAVLAGLSLLFMMMVIAVGVVLRFVFAYPILGSNEIIQLASVAVVMLALPYCTEAGGHVRVDVLDEAIGREGRFSGDILSRLLSGFVLSALVWRAWLKALDAFEYNDATNMLNLPIWPFYAMIAAGMALCVLVFVAQIVLLLAGRYEQ